MATDASFVERVRERAAPLDLTARPMFGEYGVYLRGKFVGVICDNTLFIKPTDAAAALAGRIARSSPYPGAKDHLRISSAKLNDRDWLVALLEATWAALPDAKASKRR